ncbi:MAG: Ig-like domain-containing protein [Pseudolabrys sp.]
MPPRLLAAAALIVLLPVSAHAGCLYKPFDFHPEKNDGVVVTSIVDAGSSCTHNFGEGPGYKFTGITVARAPDHGKLAPAGANRFIYTPDKSFTGKDAYLFRICATKGSSKGCSTVAFVPEVK